MRSALLLLFAATIAHGAEVPWLKGQTHVHTNRSGDSNTPPGEVARWYAARGYDFIILTDHNRITSLPPVGKLLVLPGVELTQNVHCAPPPKGEDVCLLHVNALVVRPSETLPWKDAAGPSRLEIFERALDATRALGGVAQLNHPNFHRAVDAPLLLELTRRGLRLFEVANMSSDVHNEADATRLSTEQLWDAVLTRGATLFGVASDDAHHYDDAAAVRASGQPAFTGDRGFVMVHATPDAAAIGAALARGDFYSSTGIRLARVATKAGALEVEVAGAGRFTTVFIGEGGRELSRQEGPRARFAIPARGYLRAVVSDDSGRRAWIQPVRRP